MSAVQYISGFTVINSMFRDLRMDFEEWENDAMVWAFEALNFIGTIQTQQPSSKVLHVKDFRAPLPESLKYVRRVYRHKGNRIPFKKNGDFSFAVRDDEPSYESKDFPVEVRTEKRSYYYLEPNYLKFSFNEGLVDLYFYSYPVDKSGFPLIPDNEYLKKAIKYYIMRMMAMGGHEFKNKAFTFQNLDHYWEVSKVQASNDLAFPSPEENADFISEFTNMYPDYDL